MGEGIGSEMAVRSFHHLLQYGNAMVRRAVPLALAMLYISNPDYAILDLLSKLSHDAHLPTAQSAILALGLVSAGTNNSRCAGSLRQLSAFYGKDSDTLFCVRVAQGWLHAGKGLLTMAPYHSDGLLMIPAAMAGILTTLHLSFDLKNTF